MDAADLEYQARTRSGCIPPELVSRLLERGHATVVEQQAGRGEWFCALAWARLLGERGRQAEALEALAPYRATGWWTAVVAVAELLEGWGRVEEAIEITRVRMKAGHPMALEFYTRLLARHGRAEEAFTLLRPYVGECSLTVALVDVAAAAGREEEAVALLVPRTEHRCSGFPWCCGGLDRDMAIRLIATIRERQGRTDEAIALLCTGGTTPRSHREQLAALLAREGRLGELRAAAEDDESGHAVQQLAWLLEERGDVEGAITAYRQADGTAAHGANSAFELARLLARNGRGKEAIDVMRVQADGRNGDDWVVHVLSELCLEQGRPEDGLAHLEALAAACGGEVEWDLYWIRLPLIAARDGVDEAIAQARSHPEGATSYAAPHIAELLAGAGRTEEAVAVLEQHAHENSHDLAGYLIDLGRVEDALAVLQRRPPATGA
ncbi:tetratricopeptide repeat protein [Actinacidiphila glaucinigra]|uniref:tetratricopeptide repeat protein n=1 Tax=Actinacidiphila glaucinigra TaxID=235986 RepID=UPI000B77A6B8|nr:tetratricopeptide repeat protein [Actinacidiphila glaucinigra]